ncbi:uncharacterized protein LOC129594951 [Paramacrobiotus metropolitanus]|uniref:uncharacterized protein LOC129594951 n=1 Tax=Paramacrobiotus metropolitanus TaxID=2943436 RepID=UPI002445F075|nr:uncharacterized protein LOC129594951 [Paramacrobiotus metropolitanus]
MCVQISSISLKHNDTPLVIPYEWDDLYTFTELDKEDREEHKLWCPVRAFLGWCWDVFRYGLALMLLYDAVLRVYEDCARDPIVTACRLLAPLILLAMQVYLSIPVEKKKEMRQCGYLLLLSLLLLGVCFTRSKRDAVLEANNRPALKLADGQWTYTRVGDIGNGAFAEVNPTVWQSIINNDGHAIGRLRDQSIDYVKLEQPPPETRCVRIGMRLRCT